METETNTPTLREHTADCGRLVVTAGRRHILEDALVVTRADLEAIVQAAYDRFGIIAEPSYALEAERATEATTAPCRCGIAGCSGSEPDPTRDGLQRVFA